MSIDKTFFETLERRFPGSDIPSHNDSRLHNHGSSTIRYGRGAVLTIDLTNRCNMMCDPCFMDANQVGFVHELNWEEIKKLLDDSITLKPRRQLSVQFSGGEPTISPHSLDAVRYARKVGYNSVQAATNGIRFAQEPEYAKQAAEAGLRFVYLQFDGIGNAPNAHRRVGNLFDVKLRAIENLHQAGVEIVPVTTIVNGINNEQVGNIVKFALDNPRKIAFQPVSFTGRDEQISDERRQDRWNFLFIAGMWFQDLFNYDFRRTERCVIPYATQEGEISFCAYNTGVGWRNIVEKMHMTATLTKWYEEEGRHEIYAGGRRVAMESAEHSLTLDQKIVTQDVQLDLDNLGIPKNSREEKRKTRSSAQMEHEKMERMYRRLVLKQDVEEPAEFVQIK